MTKYIATVLVALLLLRENTLTKKQLRGELGLCQFVIPLVVNQDRNFNQLVTSPPQATTERKEGMHNYLLAYAQLYFPTLIQLSTLPFLGNGDTHYRLGLPISSILIKSPSI